MNGQQELFPQHDGLVTAKRAGNVLAWFRMPATPAAAFWPGLPMVDRQDQGLYPVGGSVMVSMSFGLLLFAPTQYLVPHLYGSSPGSGNIRRQNVAVSVDEAGIRIDGLASFERAGLIYPAPIRGDDYNGDDLTLSAPGRLPVIIRSSAHIDALSADIEGRRGRTSIEAGTIRSPPLP